MNLRDLGRLIRVDLQIVADMIDEGARVLDVGCGDGALLYFLDRNKRVDARGIELSMAGVSAAVAQGLSVIQGDADTDLKDYPDQAFDYVVLSQTLQATWEPREVINHMLRIGRHAIVSFPNFGHWRVRWQLVTRGRMPVTGVLQHQWYDTPNIHLCTIKDFVALCRELDITIERGITLDSEGNILPWDAGRPLANLLGNQAVFLLTRR